MRRGADSAVRRPMHRNLNWGMVLALASSLAVWVTGIFVVLLMSTG